MTLSKWYLVKPELGPTDEFPKGSPARAFCSGFPLRAMARSTSAACAAAERDAFVRRFWENEADVSGALLRLTAPDGAELPFRVVSISPG